MKNYLQFDFEIQDADQSDRLVALLSEEGFDAFHESGGTLQACISEDKFDEQSFQKIHDLFTSLIYTTSIVEEANWNKKWEEGFDPVLVEDPVHNHPEVYIRADFHPPMSGVRYDILITPKMSFGTGHHPTTHLMVTQMLGIDFSGKSVLDFGTGTGILAIMAEKLGAASVLAIDNDDWSIENARENIKKNNCTRIDVQQGDDIPTQKKFDIFLVNITLHTILELLPNIKKSCLQHSMIVLSGFLKDDLQQLTETLDKNKLKYIKTLERGDWCMVVASNPE